MLLTVLAYASIGYVLFVMVMYLWGWCENYSHPFNWRSTANEVAETLGGNLKGKYILITGCNSGIGKETAKILLKYGAHVIMCCRNKSKAEKAKNDILQSLCREMHLLSTQIYALESRIEVRILDLSSLKSVSSFARNFVKSKSKLHILVNNAGIMALPKYTESADKYELQFATNHLGHFYLTYLLMNRLIECNKKSKSMGRVINLSSVAHVFPLPLQHTMDQCLRNVSGPQPNVYNNWMNYGFSKAANILHAKALNRRYGNDESNVYSVSLHPGVIASDLTQNLRWYERWGSSLVYSIPSGCTKSIACGAATTVYTVCLDDEQFKKHGGRYFKDCNVSKNLLKESKQCDDIKLQEKLWTLSEKLITEKEFELVIE